MDRYIPPPYRRDPHPISSHRPPLKALSRYDGQIRLGKQRQSMAKNPVIFRPQADVGEHAPSTIPLPPKSYTYGRLYKKSKHDNAKSAMDDWQTFDINEQLRMLDKHHRRKDSVGANIRALEAGCTKPKEWNKFVKQQNDLWCYAPEHTQRSYHVKHKVKVPEKVERSRIQTEDMYRVLANDYGREWFRNEYARANHEIALQQIEQRMLGTKFNTTRAAYYVRGQDNLRRGHEEQENRRLIKLARVDPPLNVRNAKTTLNTFRDGDNRKKGWRVSDTNMCQWECSRKPVNMDNNEKTVEKKVMFKETSKCHVHEGPREFEKQPYIAV